MVWVGGERLARGELMRLPCWGVLSARLGRIRREQLKRCQDSSLGRDEQGRNLGEEARVLASRRSWDVRLRQPILMKAVRMVGQEEAGSGREGRNKDSDSGGVAA